MGLSASLVGFILGAAAFFFPKEKGSWGSKKKGGGIYNPAKNTKLDSQNKMGKTAVQTAAFLFQSRIKFGLAKKNASAFFSGRERKRLLGIQKKSQRIAGAMHKRFPC